MNKISKYRDFLSSYRINKTSLKTIVKQPETLKIINDKVLIVAEIVRHTYQFLKLYYLHKKLLISICI